MCRTKMAIRAGEPTSSPRTHLPRSPKPKPKPTSTTDPSSSSSAGPSTSNNTTNTSGSRLSSRTSNSSRTSLSSLRETLPEKPHIYDFAEICSATNNFLSKRYSSASNTPSWRCNLRSRDVIVFQRKFRRKIDTAHLRERLSLIGRSHHISIIKLLGASISGEHIYLVYEYADGANLSDCLRNPRNPNFTVLNSWLSRMQVATDLAHGLDYIHNSTGLNISLVHNHIKSSSVIVTEPSFNAKICHFGAAQMCGEIDVEDEIVQPRRSPSMISIREEENAAEPLAAKSKEMTRSGSGKLQFAGIRGYMSPEFQATGVATQKSDVYAFGVVILELLSGQEPLRFKFDKETGEFVKTSVIETARWAVGGGGEVVEGKGGNGEIEGRLRKWVDKRVGDSFPIEVAEKVTRIALDCVRVEPEERPGMGLVAGKISKLYLKSKKWSDSVHIPTGISVSFAPR